MLELHRILDLEELTWNGRIVLKLEFNKRGFTFWVLVVVSIYGGEGCFFFVFNLVSISSSFSISIYFDICIPSSFPFCSVIILTFCFRLNTWEDNFSFICASNFPTLEATCLICFSKLWLIDLISYWKDMIFYCKVIVLKEKIFIITRRSSLDDDDPITLE